jgi:hypothetical protein
LKNALSTTFVRLIYGSFLFVLLSGSIEGQIPPVGIIDFYGLKNVTEQQARQALQIKEGDELPESSKEAQGRLENLPNVEQAELNVVCCEAGKIILYVGISEKGSTTLQFSPQPKGAIRLPEVIVEAGEEFEKALTEAGLKGDFGEDDSQGHALFNNPRLRAVQKRYVTFASQYFKQLRAVIRHSSDSNHRALAAQVIAYYKNKRRVVKDLVFGMKDSNSEVRNNSMRALGVLAEFAQKFPERRIKIPVEPFIQMLNSIDWTDRNKSSIALLKLTADRNPTILSKLRIRTLLSLVEMARWKSLGHATAPFILLGRIGNLSEDNIQKALESGSRESLIESVLETINNSDR